MLGPLPEGSTASPPPPLGLSLCTDSLLVKTCLGERLHLGGNRTAPSRGQLAPSLARFGGSGLFQWPSEPEGLPKSHSKILQQMKSGKPRLQGRPMPCPRPLSLQQSDLRATAHRGRTRMGEARARCSPSCSGAEENSGPRWTLRFPVNPERLRGRGSDARPPNPRGWPASRPRG